MMTVKEYLKLDKKYPKPGEEGYDKLVEYNKELCTMYPFLKPKNVWTGAELDDYDYSYTELDCMPEGWRIAFGMKMCEEIKQALLKAQKEFPNEGYKESEITTNYDSDKIIPLLEGYTILQIKEKYGGLRWYDGGAPKYVHDVVSKYEKLSYKTCIVCGKPAKYRSAGWVSPYCRRCAHKIYNSYDGPQVPFYEVYVKMSKLKEEE